MGPQLLHWEAVPARLGWGTGWYRLEATHLRMISRQLVASCKAGGASGAFRLVQPPSSGASGAMPMNLTGEASGASGAKSISGSPVRSQCDISLMWT